MLIGTLSGIGYARFAEALILPALLSVGCVYLVLRFAFGRELLQSQAPDPHVPEPPLDRKHALLCVGALVFVVAGFVAGYNLAWTAMVGAALLLILTRGDPREIFAQVDGTLLLFFAALFVVTHGVAQAGVTEMLYRWLEPAFGSDAIEQTFRFGAFTVVACQIVSNVPFVLLAGHWIPKLADPQLGWLSLSLVSTLAGNLTPVASVANLIVLELAGSRGKISFGRFLAVGAGATFLPLAVGLATLLVERRLGLLGH
jgi:Na+/H+ antiporter NhaD/arsenite permease-like protein